MNQKQKKITCPHETLCPGCTQQGVPLAVEKMRNFFKPWALDVSYIVGPETEWRSRAKLAVRAFETGCSVGLFRESSHDIVPMFYCQMHTPALNKALDVCVRRFQSDSSLSFYNEALHQGSLRYLLLSEETTSSTVSVVFVLNLSEHSKEGEKWIKLAHELMTGFPTLFHSFWLNFQSGTSNTITGDLCQHVVGKFWQWEHVRNVWLPFHPLHFRQANLPLFSTLLGDLEEHIPHHTHIVDLFGGMGAIGLALAHMSTSVTCVEIDPSAMKSFDEAKRRLPEALQSIVSFHSLSCNGTEMDAILQEAETIIVDPPRKGLSHSLMKRISESPASTAAYVSCSYETLLPNLEELFKMGWKPVFAKAYQFFPRTTHLESLVIVKRAFSSEKMKRELLCDMKILGVTL